MELIMSNNGEIKPWLWTAIGWSCISNKGSLQMYFLTTFTIKVITVLVSNDLAFYFLKWKNLFSKKFHTLVYNNYYLIFYLWYERSYMLIITWRTLLMNYYITFSIRKVKKIVKWYSYIILKSMPQNAQKYEPLKRRNFEITQLPNIV